jgi:hypothetical protein
MPKPIIKKEKENNKPLSNLPLHNLCMPASPQSISKKLNSS